MPLHRNPFDHGRLFIQFDIEFPLAASITPAARAVPLASPTAAALAPGPPLPTSHRDRGSPRSPIHICTGTGLTHCHVCTGTGLTPALTCTGTGLAPAASRTPCPFAPEPPTALACAVAACAMAACITAGSACSAAPASRQTRHRCSQELAKLLPPATAEAVPEGAEETVLRNIVRGSAEDKTAPNNAGMPLGACRMLHGCLLRGLPHAA
jgi:hypothetical protein